jgi:hypothetical protein
MKNVAVKTLWFFCLANTVYSFSQEMPQESIAPEKTEQQAEQIASVAVPPVDQYALLSSACIYVCSAASGAGEHAILQISQNQLNALAPQTVTYNYRHNQLNPFYDQHISILRLLNHNPIIAVPGPSLYLIEKFPSDTPMEVLGAENIQDARGDVCKDIVGISWARTGSSPATLANYIFAAVTPHDAQWGGPASGIALIKIDRETIEKKFLYVRFAISLMLTTPLRLETKPFRCMKLPILIMALTRCLDLE